MSLYASNCDEQLLVLVCMMLKSLHGLWQTYINWPDGVTTTIILPISQTFSTRRTPSWNLT